MFFILKIKHNQLQIKNYALEFIITRKTISQDQYGKPYHDEYILKECHNCLKISQECAKILILPI